MSSEGIATSLLSVSSPGVHFGDDGAARDLARQVNEEAVVIPDLARLPNDLAGFPIPRQLDAILALTTLEHLHYGSDYPFTPEFVVEMGVQALANAGDPAGSVARALAGKTRRLFAGGRNLATE